MKPSRGTTAGTGWLSSLGGSLLWLRIHQDAADALLAATLLGFGLFGLSAGASQWLVVALFVPLARRRREPRAVLWMVSAAAAAVWLSGDEDGITAAAGVIAFYTVGRHVERPASLHAFAATTALLVVVAASLAAAGAESSPWFSVLARSGVIVASFGFGDGQRSRTALLASLREHAARMELARVADAQRAVLDERSRIAREVHDVVAHSLCVMVIQASAAERLATKDPEGSITSIKNVAEVGRSALGEMRRIFGILESNATPSDFAPQPNLSDLDALVERCRNAGLDVTLTRDGSPPIMSAGMQLSIVRIVQESLTNIMKHAPQAHATVQLSFADGVTIEIADDGNGKLVDAEVDGRGRGIVGMRERVEALQGSFFAGPTATGGFMVRAVIPAEPAGNP